MKKLTDEGIDKAISKGLVILYFWADWCGPCRAMKPGMDELCKKYKGRVDFYKVNADDSPQALADYQVVSVPTTFLFKGGILQGASIGATTQLEVEEMFRDYL